jgi:hypothetical protein
MAALRVVNQHPSKAGSRILVALALLDHLVRRGQQRFRDGEAEGLGGLHINDKFNSRLLLDRQGQNVAVEYAIWRANSTACRR